MQIMYSTYHIKEMLYVTTYRKTLVRSMIYASLLLLAVLVSLVSYLLSKEHHLSRYQTRFPTDLKYILFWTPPSGRKRSFKNDHHEFALGQSEFIRQNCSHINCYVTYNKSLLNEDMSNFDAVVFDVQYINKLSIDDLNLTRSPYQSYIFRAQESAEKHPICSHSFEDFFNLTWTYKLNSDIPQPFINIYDVKNKLVGPKRRVGWVKKMNHTENYRNKRFFKTKAVAWIVDKCRIKNKHKDFIEELRSELSGYNYSVDMYGSCGDKKCTGHSVLSCYKMVERKYFFHLVLEEFSSDDYVTEMIVKSFNYFTIPIILGGADYTRFLPPGSYINARTFDIKKLGALLDYLIRNPAMYQLFFDWKTHYFYTTRPRSDLCGLCTKLNSNNSPSRVHKPFRHWWNPQHKDICQRMKLLSLFS